MSLDARLRYLRVVLVLTGAIFVVGVYLMITVWPSGWRWAPYQPQMEQMIVGIYATLGVFLLIAARDPMKHLSLIWFTVWSSVVHAGIMAAQAMTVEHEMGHMMGDVPALIIVAVALAALTPRGIAVQPAR